MEIKGYELIKKEYLKDIASDGYLYKHVKSGAMIAIIHNDDTNKVFNVGFRTPVYNHTGVPHILEHSVLCGSKKYPVKDPFIELAKGSLNTFLNAMTYPDKTVYPIASYNDKDYKSLCDVYMDAVLNPNIYRYEEIFRQEGWGYQMESEDDELIINGVVYNEMKGAFSDPDSILSSAIDKALYPDTTYSYESGGDPDHIPELTYEEFINFHKTYYHPSNSYIYFYGNVDIAERLEWLDKEYLSHYDVLELDSEIKWQKKAEKPVEKWIEYPISEDEDGEDKFMFSYTAVLDSILNMDEYYGMTILDSVLMSNQAAVLKKRLLEAGVARDVRSVNGMWIQQPEYAIMAKEAEESKLDLFNSIIKETLEEIVEKGFDKEELRAAIEITEFNIREDDYGSYPKGLMYGLNLMDTWLYDKNEPFMIFDYEGVFKRLREGVDNGYYEGLVKKYLIDNTHTAKVYARPVKGLATAKEDALKKKLQEYKNSLSKEEIRAIIERTETLKAFQQREEKEEDIQKIPLLSLEDIDKEPEKWENIERNIGETKVVFHNLSTNKIIYMDAYLETVSIEEDKLSYVGLLTDTLRRMDTKKHTYGELDTCISMHTGGMYVEKSIINLDHEPGKFRAFILLKGKALYGKTDKVTEYMNEVLTMTRFDDYARLKEIIGQVKAGLENHIMNSSSAAQLRANSYHSKSSLYCEKTSGIEYYRFLCRIDRNFDEMKEEVAATLTRILSDMVTRGNILMNVTCDEEGYKLLEKNAEILFKDVPEGKKADAVRELKTEKKNEGFKTSSQVQYVAKVGNFKNAGFEYNGSMSVLCNIMGSDYLWKKVRVDGGAYGCSFVMTAWGDLCFCSYRDPHLKNTLKVFDETVEFLENFQASKRDMDKVIIGTISSIDKPMTARAKGSSAMVNYVKGVTFEEYKKRRTQVLETTAEDIRALAEPVKAVLAMENICVVGNEAKVAENSHVFDVVTIPNV